MYLKRLKLHWERLEKQKGKIISAWLGLFQCLKWFGAPGLPKDYTAEVWLQIPSTPYLIEHVIYFYAL